MNLKILTKKQYRDIKKCQVVVYLYLEPLTGFEPVTYSFTYTPIY